MYKTHKAKIVVIGSLYMDIVVETDRIPLIGETLRKKVILNPAPALDIPKDIFNYIDYMTPNQTELAYYTGIDDVGEKIETAILKMTNLGVSHVITTLGSDGSVYLKEGKKVTYQKGYTVPVVDTTGAGDCYNAALAV
ncbi:PfkB family carbohydrate kinase [Oceanobacillus salinisoli]|uniref:PfkB family carbohydrate kinase n=1 Tax=Oceanobacillus salinisoli TaxID=2678611 RepID=UPI0012E14AF9|nr:PfkB family carbohydrate kinase [Oceanobacillus salinisoli]